MIGSDEVFVERDKVKFSVRFLQAWNELNSLLRSRTALTSANQDFIPRCCYGAMSDIFCIGPSFVACWLPPRHSNSPILSKRAVDLVLLGPRWQNALSIASPAEVFQWICSFLVIAFEDHI